MMNGYSLAKVQYVYIINTENLRNFRNKYNKMQVKVCKLLCF